MVTRQTKFGSFSSSSQERVEQTAQQAGIADGLGHLIKMGPQVLALQQSLLVGIAQSQKREAERLAKLYGNDEGAARVAQAAERASQVAQLYTEAKAQGTMVSRVVQTFQQDGIFHGYVHLADGTAAAGYTVKLERSANDKKVPRALAKTDETGYFRIELSTAGENDQQQGIAQVRRWTERLARLVDDDMAAEPPHEEAAAAAAAKADKAAAVHVAAEPATSSVQVLNPNGRVVLEDPQPPTFEHALSEFRYYVITDAAHTRSTRKTGKKPLSGTRR